MYEEHKMEKYDFNYDQIIGAGPLGVVLKGKFKYFI